MKKIILLIVLAILVAAFFWFDLGQYLTLDQLKQQQTNLDQFFQNNRLLTIAIYFVAYVLMAALSLPGAALMTLAGGAIFGLALGTVVVSFASSMGATLAFLFARFLLGDTVQNKFGDKLRAINDGIDKDGAFYLFTLRLVPVFPFFVINLVMGLTRLKAWTFYWVSQVGMLLGTAIYVNAGTQLAQLDSLSGILSPNLIFSFVLLGVFPLIAKKLVGFLRSRKNAVNTNTTN